MTDDDRGLDDLFKEYRAACPDIEASANFTPRVWEKIESRRGFWFAFQGLGRAAMAASTAVCLLLLILNFIAGPQMRLDPTYADALAADHTAEKTYYAEAIRATPERMQSLRTVH